MDVRFEQAVLELSQGPVTVTGSDFVAASLVIYRRWRFLPEPMVKSSREDAAERHFAEREWEAVISSALLEFEQPTWVNPPSALTLARNKLWLVRHAARCGLNVPPFAIDTRLRAPAGPPGEVVCKAINEYETVDHTHTFPTTAIEQSFLASHLGERAECPSLLQARVRAERELRVIAWCGCFFAVELTTELEHTDIRLLPVSNVSYGRTQLPEEVEELLRVFMRRIRLRYCTFDFLVADGTHFLVDVTPSGLWSPFDVDGSITEEIAREVMAS